jgi:hypothetical protein
VSDLRSVLERNGYLYGVSPRAIGVLADAASTRTRALVVETDDDEPVAVGWVLYDDVPALCIYHAYVEVEFRGLGAWRVLRDALRLRDGQQVTCVLQSPAALADGRRRYKIKHNWGRVLEWLT